MCMLFWNAAFITSANAGPVNNTEKQRMQSLPWTPLVSVKRLLRPLCCCCCAPACCYIGIFVTGCVVTVPKVAEGHQVATLAHYCWNHGFAKFSITVDVSDEIREQQNLQTTHSQLVDQLMRKRFCQLIYIYIYKQSKRMHACTHHARHPCFPDTSDQAFPDADCQRSLPGLVNKKTFLCNRMQRISYHRWW